MMKQWILLDMLAEPRISKTNLESMKIQRMLFLESIKMKFLSLDNNFKLYSLVGIQKDIMRKHGIIGKQIIEVEKVI